VGLHICTARIPVFGPGFRVFVLTLSLLFARTAISAPGTLAAAAAEVLDAVHAQYAAVSNVSCTVRREAADGRGGKAESMSRIVWARGDRMNVQMLKPAARRTVIDGETIRIKGPRDEAPAIYHVTNQTPSQVANLRSVPGSPEELLAPLSGLLATSSGAKPPFARTVTFMDKGPDGTPAFPLATVSFDDLGRVGRIDFPPPPDDAEDAATSTITFHGAFEALPGVWLFRRVETETNLGGRSLRTVSRFDKFSVNGELPASLFDPKAFF
jgi:outer membrane lipoprotein-sorting protein